MSDGISDPVKKWGIIGIIMVAFSMLSGRLLAYYGVSLPGGPIYAILGEIIFWLGAVGAFILLVILVILLRERRT